MESASSLKMNFYEARLWSVARMPEQIFDYEADVEFLIFNAATEFKYSEEIGVGLTLLESLDLTMSKSGTAFYQTTLERCFNLPPVPEIIELMFILTA